MRALIAAGCMIGLAAGASFAQEAASDEPVAEADIEYYRPDPFVIAPDGCRASDWDHLVNRDFASVDEASLPNQTRVVRSHMASTLEFKPQRLNVILGEGGRVAVVGCF